MVLKKKTKRKNLRYFRNVFITSLLVLLQILTPIQAANALSVPDLATLTKDLALAAISEQQANQYTTDLQTPTALDFSDNQAVQLAEDTNDHYFFVQNTLKENDQQVATEINVPEGYEYNEVSTKQLNGQNKSVDLSYRAKDHQLSIKWSQAAAKSAVFVLSGKSSAAATLYATTVSQGMTFRSNQLNLISEEIVSNSTSSETDSSNETAKNTTDNSTTTTSTSEEGTQSTTTSKTSANQSNKVAKTTVQGSSFDSYEWEPVGGNGNEFLAAKSPTNPNYYEVIGFGGIGDLYWSYLSGLQITQEQMFVLKADKVANQETGPTMDEIKDNAVGYLFTAGGSNDGHGDWNGTYSQGISFVFADGTIFQTNPGGGTEGVYNKELKIKTVEKAVSEDGLPMLKASTDSIDMGNGHIYQLSTILKILPTGRVAHYYTFTNMGKTTDTPTVTRAIHTYLGSEHMTQTYALGNNKGMYLQNTVNEDGSLAYDNPQPARVTDPYKVEFPVDGYEGEPDNWLGTHEIFNANHMHPEQLMAEVFDGADKDDQYKSATGDEVKNFPADFNLLTADGSTNKDGGLFFKWNNLSIAPGETQMVRYDTALEPLGTLNINAEKTYTNETNPGSVNHEGDKLKFDLKGKNTSKQVWTSGKIVDVIPDGLTVDPSTLTLVGTDGTEQSLPASDYDASTKTLTVNLPDVDSDQEVHVKFEATIDEGTAGTTITNTMQAVDASENTTSASVDVKVEEYGDLTLDFVPNLYFGLNTITTKDTTYNAYAMESNEEETKGQYVSHYVQVSDHRGEHTGWTLGVAQTDPFTSESGATLGSNTEISLMDAKITGTSSDRVKPSYLASLVTLTPNDEVQQLVTMGESKEETFKDTWGDKIETESRYTEDPDHPEVAPELKDVQVNKSIQLTVPGKVKKMSEKYVTNLDWVLSDTPTS